MQYGYRLVSPTWPQLKVGPLLRGELDSRSYFFMFRPLAADVRGLRRLMVLLTRKKVSEHECFTARDGDLVVTSGMGGLFEGLLDYSDFLRDELTAMLSPNRLPELERKHGSNGAIAVHVRFGDFSAVDLQVSKSGGANRRQPIEWYMAAVEAVRKILGEDAPVNVFSDAADKELAPLLSMPRVARVYGNNAIEDILLISSHKLLIASGSTFSMWASFLGQIPTIWFPGQKKFHLVRTSEHEVEFEAGTPLPQGMLSRIA